MWKNKNIFDCESEEEEGFKINENYAERYDKWRSKEEYEKLKARAETLASSSDETSDEDGEGKDFGKPHNPGFDKEFLLSIGTIYKHRKGDIDDLNEVKFFSGDYRIEKEKKEKPLTVKDFQRQVLLQNGGEFEEDEIGRQDKAMPGTSKIIKFDDGLDDSDDDGDGLLNSGLFKVKDDANTEADNDANKAPENVAAAFIKGAITSVAETEHKDVLETLKGAWNDEKMSKKDKWLVDFFLNERYLADDNDNEYYNDIDLDEEELSDGEPEQELNPLATQYKFRHQEPGDLIKRHPRQITDTLRQKDQKRSQKREAAKERRLKKKEEKKQEIEILKALKYKEIEEKIDKIREASGNEDIDLGHVDLEEDFDPDAHDAHMQKLLGENYYDNSNVEVELPDFEDEPDDGKLYDNWTRSDAANGDSYQEGNEFEEDYYDEDFNMDADYDPESASAEAEKRPAKSSARKRRGRRSKFSQALEKEKPIFNPKEKDFASYFDEYYQLDFEDVVGGMPCRFKYRKVESNNFGLTTGEILSAQNSDLNRWVGIKKIMQYDRSKELEAHERQKYSNRATHEHIKLKILPSLFVENAEELAEKEREKRRLKNQKKKQKKWKLREGINDNAENPTALEVGKETLEQPVVTEGYVQLPKKQKQRGESEDAITTTTTTISSEDRIENSENYSIDQQQMATDVVGKKKKKKKKKDRTASEGEETLEQLVVTEGDVQLPKKKRQRDESEDVQTITTTTTISSNDRIENNENYSTDQQQMATDVVGKKKKKKKKKDPAASEGGEEILEQLVVTEGDVQLPKKKKQRDESEDVQTTTTTTTISSEDRIENSENHSTDQQQTETDLVGKKKKKRRDCSADVPSEEITSNNPKKKRNHKSETDGDKNPKENNRKEKVSHMVLMTGNPKKRRKSQKVLTKCKQKRKDHYVRDKMAMYFKGISDERLEAYGQNPKKLKNTVLYGKSF